MAGAHAGSLPSQRELTIGEIVTLTRRQAAAADPLDRRIGNIAPLDQRGAADITFSTTRKFLDALGGHAGRRLPSGAAL